MMTLTILAARFIRKGAMPIDTILRMILFFGTQQSRRKCTGCFGLKKWLSTNNEMTNIEMTVATAAPLISMPNPKINSGSSRIFSPTPIRMVYIDLLGYPLARMMLLKL